MRETCSDTGWRTLILRPQLNRFALEKSNRSLSHQNLFAFPNDHQGVRNVLNSIGCHREEIGHCGKRLPTAVMTTVRHLAESVRKGRSPSAGSPVAQH